MFSLSLSTNLDSFFYLQYFQPQVKPVNSTPTVHQTSLSNTHTLTFIQHIKSLSNSDIVWSLIFNRIKAVLHQYNVMYWCIPYKSYVNYMAGFYSFAIKCYRDLKANWMSWLNLKSQQDLTAQLDQTRLSSETRGLTLTCSQEPPDPRTHYKKQSLNIFGATTILLQTIKLKRELICVNVSRSLVKGKNLSFQHRHCQQ